MKRHHRVVRTHVCTCFQNLRLHHVQLKRETKLTWDFNRWKHSHCRLCWVQPSVHRVITTPVGGEHASSPLFKCWAYLRMLHYGKFLQLTRSWINYSTLLLIRRTQVYLLTSSRPLCTVTASDSSLGLENNVRQGLSRQQIARSMSAASACILILSFSARDYRFHFREL